MGDENGHLPSVLLRNFFWKVDVINRMYRQNWQAHDISSNVKALDMESFARLHQKQIVVAPKIEGSLCIY